MTESQLKRQAKRRKAFQNYLENSKRIRETWPSWKVKIVTRAKQETTNKSD